MEDRVQIYRGTDQLWHWKRIRPDASLVSASACGLTSVGDAMATARRVNAQPYILEANTSRDDTLITDASAGLVVDAQTGRDADEVNAAIRAGTVFAPFTHSQVDSLNAFQTQPGGNPFLCGNDPTHFLVAELDGWRCVVCAYVQLWAHREMTDWTWKSLAPARDGD
jgi:hypothetical protein